MELISLQRQLLGLMKSTYQVSETDTAYIRAVAQSPQLKVVQDIIEWWRMFSLAQYSFLTVPLLKRRNLFQESLRKLVALHPVSPFREVMGMSFLREMSSHHDALISAVSQFELAFILVKQGDAEEYVIDWQHEPYQVLASLLNGTVLDDESIRGSYQTFISSNIEGMFRVVPKDLNPSIGHVIRLTAR